MFIFLLSSHFFLPVFSLFPKSLFPSPFLLQFTSTSFCVFSSFSPFRLYLQLQTSMVSSTSLVVGRITYCGPLLPNPLLHCLLCLKPLLLVFTSPFSGHHFHPLTCIFPLVGTSSLLPTGSRPCV